MKNLEKMMPEVGITIIAIMVVVMLAGIRAQNKDAEYTKRMLRRENSELNSTVHHHKIMFGKYADSISDAMLRDFYPEVSNIDSLRNNLKERYEIRLRTENDGLCY